MQEIVARLEEASRLRMVSDVPLGAFLSGGIDSSAVVALMAGPATGRSRPSPSASRSRTTTNCAYARQVAERFGTDHHEFVVRPDAAASCRKLAWHYDEPFADSSALPTYYVAQMTRAARDRGAQRRRRRRELRRL